MRQIPFGRPIIGEEERKAVLDVLSGDILVHGPKATEFEKAFAGFTGAPYALSVSSCTAGLHLAYFYLQLKAGDEVIVPAQTHTATAHAVEFVGAKPVFVDAESETGNIDIHQIESAITPRTKALSLVHYLGMPVAMDQIMAIAKKHDLFVVEDCALAIGTYYNGIHVGLHGDIGCYSFYPVKHMTTAEGGMILTKHENVAKKIHRQKAFGVDKTVAERTTPGVYDVPMLGFNYRMNELEAAIGIEQVKKLPTFLSKRKENYTFLEKNLREFSEFDVFRSSHGPFESSYYCQSILLKPNWVSKRHQIVESLKAQGVGTSVYYPKAVPHLTYYKNKYGYTEDTFPVAKRISETSIALSVGPHLNLEDMDYTVKALKKTLQSL